MGWRKCPLAQLLHQTRHEVCCCRWASLQLVWQPVGVVWQQKTTTRTATEAAAAVSAAGSSSRPLSYRPPNQTAMQQDRLPTLADADNAMLRCVLWSCASCCATCCVLCAVTLTPAAFLCAASALMSARRSWNSASSAACLQCVYNNKTGTGVRIATGVNTA